MVSAYNSGNRQPAMSMGLPSTDQLNRGMLWALGLVSLVFLLIILAYAISSGDDTSGEGALAPVTVVAEAAD